MSSKSELEPSIAAGVAEKTEAVEPETAEDALARVLASLRGNHANTLPMVEILRAAAKGERPYRELEDSVRGLPVMDMSHNNEHVLSQMLVKCGALKMIPVEEPASEASEAPAAEAVAEGADPLPDMPVDYLLAITPAGLAAVAEYEPTKTLSEMLASDPQGYAEVYVGILRLCDGGARLADIEFAFGKHPAMTRPRQVYCGHFVSNLETAGGIVWENDCWNTTEGGRIFAAALANT